MSPTGHIPEKRDAARPIPDFGSVRVEDLDGPMSRTSPIRPFTQRTQRIQKEQRLVGKDNRRKSLAIDLTSFLPGCKRTAKSCAWRLARRIKSTDPDATGSDVARLAVRWHRKCPPRLRIGARDDPSVAVTLLVEAWSRVEVPEHEGIVPRAVQRATARTDTPDAAAGLGAKIELLARLCRELGEVGEAGEFHLSARDAATALGVSPPTALKHLRTLREVGLLELVRLGERVPGGKATEYRWNEAHK